LSRRYNLKNIHRVIDANINRAKEGLRVCEEVTRFILDSRHLSAALKEIRHKIDTAAKRLPLKINLISYRNTKSDIGRTIYAGELKRKNCRDIFFANIQRAQESVRVLEEFSKLIDANIAIGFKKIRYKIYEIERKVAIRMR
jgi:thiamine-phosphate pyrophosphorylase